MDWQLFEAFIMTNTSCELGHEVLEYQFYCPSTKTLTSTRRILVFVSAQQELYSHLPSC